MAMKNIRRNVMAQSMMNALEIQTATGNPVVFNTQIAKPLNSLVVPLSYTQEGSGDPYPPGGGKNKFDKDAVVRKDNYAIEYSGEIVASTSSGFTENFIPVKSSTTYTLSGNGGRVIAYYDENEEFLSRESTQDTPFSFISRSDAKYIRIQYRLSDVDMSTWQLEEGSSATTYAPYSNIRPISGVSSLSAYRIGINIFDEELEEGMLNTSTGQNSPSSSNIRSKNYISVVPGKQYYVKFTGISGGTNMRVFSYYADKSYKNNQWVTSTTTFTIPSDVHYIRFYMDTAYSANGNRKISINYPNTETDYIPYNGIEVSVVFPTLGKNLCNTSADNIVPFEYSGYDNYTISNGTVHVTGNTLFGFKVPVMPLTKYRWSLNITSNITIEAFDYESEPDKIRNSDHTCYYTTNATEGTITVPEGSNWIAFAFYTTKTDITISNIQIEPGETTTSYEPYNNSVYGGSLDLVSGVLTLNWKLFEAKYLTWETTSQSSNGVFICRDIGAIRDSSKKFNIVCNQYKTSNQDISISSMDDLSIKGNESEKTRVYIRNSNYTDADSFAATLDDVYFACELETPITVQLNSHTITTIKGTNTVWTNTSENLTVTYKNKKSQGT